MLNWLRQWWQKQVRVEPSEDSVFNLARKHGLNRRDHARVQVPPISVGLSPSLKYEQADLQIVNLSTGGACVLDNQDRLLPHLSQTIELDLFLPGHHERLTVRVVGVSGHVNRHLQFLNLQTKTRKRIETIVQMGCYGKKLKQSPTLQLAPAQLNVVELWTGMPGDALVFYNSQESMAELSVGSLTIHFYPQIEPRLLIGADPRQSRAAFDDEIMNILVCLVNVASPSERLIELIQRLNQRPPLWSKTGSGK